MSPKSTTYEADSIAVLEGLLPVRVRPGMYIGSTGPAGLHHLVWEVVDNAVDEAMAGHCTRIEVTLLAGGGCRVTDNGRGIPVGRHPSYPKKSAAEVALTVLHAGGKFGDGGYKVSGGLHGVGVSVVNALSDRLDLDIWRDGKHWRMSFAPVGAGRAIKPGEPTGPLKAVGDAPRGCTGTQVTFWPAPSVFETVEFSARTIMERLQVMAFLNQGLEINFRDERPEHEQERLFSAQGGIVDFVRHLNTTKAPLFEEVGSFTAEGAEGEVDAAWQWNAGFNEGLHTFANGISTTEGGVHAEGFRKALTQAINRYARQKGLLKERAENLVGDDLREGMTAIVSVRLGDPQFEGQTKTKLGNPEIRTLVERATSEHFARWLEEHPNEAKAIVNKAALAARARVAAKKARDLTRRKTALDSGGLPGRLSDCNVRSGGELFIVEGPSAGGTAKTARDPATQAILPLKGKVLNVERAPLEKILKNVEIQALVAAIGGGMGRSFDVSKIRYDKIIILTDADVDGGHITVLLLTFFFRQMLPLLEAGKVFVAQTPLYSTEIGGKKFYIADDRERERIVAANARRNLTFSRFKGLGEMDADELKLTVMDPITRRLAIVDVEQAATADSLFGLLMGDDASARRAWIEANAAEAGDLDV